MRDITNRLLDLIEDSNKNITIEHDNKLGVHFWLHEDNKAKGVSFYRGIKDGDRDSLLEKVKLLLLN